MSSPASTSINREHLLNYNGFKFREYSYVPAPAILEHFENIFSRSSVQREAEIADARRTIALEQDNDMFEAINKAIEDKEYLEMENIKKNRKSINPISVLEI